MKTHFLIHRLALLFCTFFGLTAFAATEPPRPNILFILADDLGRNDVGFMGCQDIQTPHIDRLARDGAILDAFYVQPVCSPTRSAFLTGRYPMRYGLQVGVVRPHAQYGLPLEERTLSQGLKEAGYETAIVGKWHLGSVQPAYLPTQRGFDHQYGHYNGALDYFTHKRDGGHDWHRDDKANYDEGYATELIGRESARRIRERDTSKPLFLYVSFNAVHSPHQVPDKYLKPYGNLKGVRRIYAGMVAAMDEAIGEVLKAVEEEGLRDTTLILFSSDNGGPQPGKVTDNGLYRAGKGTLYEGGVRVAASATWPGHIESGTVIKAPMHIVDFYPTLLKLAGAPLDQKLPLDGRDIWPVLADSKPSPHDSILLNVTPDEGAVRVGDWKLVRRTPVMGRLPARREIVELFDLSADPHEKTNLAEAEPDKLKELSAVLDQYTKQAAPPRQAPIAPDFKVPTVWGESASK